MTVPNTINWLATMLAKAQGVLNTETGVTIDIGDEAMRTRKEYDALRAENERLRAERDRLREALAALTNGPLYGFEAAAVARAALEGKG